MNENASPYSSPRWVLRKWQFRLTVRGPITARIANRLFENLGWSARKEGR